jgi:hypothetical protein
MHGMKSVIGVGEPLNKHGLGGVEANLSKPWQTRVSGKQNSFRLWHVAIDQITTHAVSPQETRCSDNRKQDRLARSPDRDLCFVGDESITDWPVCRVAKGWIKHHDQ